MFKFISAIIGYFLLGRSFLGAVLGFIIGSVIDNLKVVRQDGQATPNEDIFDYYRRHASQGHEDFATMLMALSAEVMKADGRPLKSELEYIKQFFAAQFGPQYTREHLQVLKHFLETPQIPIQKICGDIKFRTQVEVRIQLLHYLFGIAKADGHVADTEISALRNIAQLLDIPQADFESVKSMFYRDVNADYHILEIEPGASDEEVKKAYRQMAVRYHPDKVASMGEEYQKGAKEKFQKLQEAYENIKKSRGMS
jgi:DnaJ like chaperone protein